MSRIAEHGCDCTELRDAGVRAEKKMLHATGGVNTHRGALFSLGLLVAAVSSLATSGRNIAPDYISEEIVRMAKQFPRPQGTHGDIAEKKFGRSGALDNARNGYAPLFKSWLPFLRAMKQEDMEWSIFNNFRKQRLLLKIMTELDDSNILYRCGAATADEVRRIAGQLLLIDNPATLDNALKELNEDFKRKRISPGGAADMVALTLFADAFSGRRAVTTNTTTTIP